MSERLYKQPVEVPDERSTLGLNLAYWNGIGQLNVLTSALDKWNETKFEKILSKE